MPKVRVVVRCRPTASSSLTSGSHDDKVAAPAPWSLQSNRIVLRGAPSTASSASGGSAANGYDKTFQFDRVYNGEEPQEQFYTSEIAPLMHAAMGDSNPPGDGGSAVDSGSSGPCHVVIFAYGQTGSGKTFTMDGKRTANLLETRRSKRQRKSGVTEAPAVMDTPATSDEAAGVSAAGAEIDEGDDVDDDDEESASDGGSGRGASKSAVSPGEGVAPRALHHVFRVLELQNVGPRGHDASSTPPPTPPADPDSAAVEGLEESGNGRPPLPTALPSTHMPTASAPPPYELVRVSVSFLEIYNEKLFDLLNASHIGNNAIGANQKNAAAFRRRRIKPSPAMVAAMNAACLRLRRCGPEAAQRGGPVKFEVENLTRVTCVSFEEALQYYYYGVSKKVFRGHNLNSQSSRAHSIFTIYLTFRDNTATEGGAGGSESPLVTSEIAIVDLAGSERLHSILPPYEGSGSTSSSRNGTPNRSGKQSGSSPSPSPRNWQNQAADQAALVSESIYINKSLLTLGKVIVALSENFLHDQRGGSGSNRKPGGSNHRRTPHTPYRDSKLTMVINHALGGNAVTLMIACMHLDASQTSESLSTLFYAARTSKISNTVTTLEDPRVARIKGLLAEVASLKAELTAANDTIETLTTMLDDAKRAQPAIAVASASNDSVARPTEQRAAASESQRLPLASQDNTGDVGAPITLANELSERLREACSKLKQVLDANNRLRGACDDERGRRIAAENELRSLETENSKLKEKLDFYDALLLAQIAINKEFPGAPQGGGRTSSRQAALQRLKGADSGSLEDMLVSHGWIQQRGSGGLGSASPRSSIPEMKKQKKSKSKSKSPSYATTGRLDGGPPGRGQWSAGANKVALASYAVPASIAPQHRIVRRTSSSLVHESHSVLLPPSPDTMATPYYIGVPVPPSLAPSPRSGAPSVTVAARPASASAAFVRPRVAEAARGAAVEGVIHQGRVKGVSSTQNTPDASSSSSLRTQSASGPRGAEGRIPMGVGLPMEL